LDGAAEDPFLTPEVGFAELPVAEKALAVDPFLAPGVGFAELPVAEKALAVDPFLDGAEVVVEFFL